MVISRALSCGVAIAVVGAACAAPAAAHVQVRPNEAAPDDPVLFEVLVPGEREVETTEVELAIPRGVIPFSYAETPGWKRSLTTYRNGAARSVVWKGSLPADGLGRFAFLASTPPKEGTVAWKAIQTYGDGKKVRWIGQPGSETPASVTRVSRSVARQNAGGEGRGGTSAAAASEAATAAKPAAAASESDTLARAFAIAAFVLGLLVAGYVVVGARRRTV